MITAFEKKNQDLIFLFVQKEVYNSIITIIDSEKITVCDDMSELSGLLYTEKSLMYDCNIPLLERKPSFDPGLRPRNSVSEKLWRKLSKICKSDASLINLLSNVQYFS